MAFYNLPVTNNTDQSFICTSLVNDTSKTYGIRIRYNPEGTYWWLTISDFLSNKIIIDDVVLVCGLYPDGDLLSQYKYLNIGCLFILPKTDGAKDRPSLNTLSTEYIVVWGDTIV